jgi:hypothetical protein
MKFKSIGILAVGAAIGYALGTENGRRKVAELKESGTRFLNRPDVQERTADLADKAKEKTGGLPPQVQGIANSTIAAAQRATARNAEGDTSSEETSSTESTDAGTETTSDDGDQTR